jgi:hypothetical protein
MVPILGVTTRRLSLGLSACIFIAVAFMLSNAVKFQLIGSKRLGFGHESFKPNANGHGYDSQAVGIDPILRESSPPAAVLDDPLEAYYPPGNGTRGNSSLPHISGLRAAVDQRESPSQDADLGATLAANYPPGNGTRGNNSLRIDSSQKESPSQDAVLDDPLEAIYPPGVSTRGNSSLPHISGLRVAFVGDSLTRYMYLSLAAYLRRGRWMTKNDVPNFLEEKQFENWNSFYNYTNRYFQPYEQCDCFRTDGKNTARKGIENRYFKDPVRDNVLYFFNK